MPAPRAALHALAIGVIVATLWGCGALPFDSMQKPEVWSFVERGARGATRATHWPIRHLIVIVQQSRSFDDLLAGYPGADAPTFGCAKDSDAGMNSGSGCPPGDSKVVLTPVPIESDRCKEVFSYAGYFNVAWDDGTMDGWNMLDPNRPLCPYTRVNRSDTKAYWHLARRFAIADAMFASTHYGVFADQLYLIAGTTELTPMVFAVAAVGGGPWACYAPPSERTAILVGGHVRKDGPYPCFTQFQTIANLFDDAGVSWRNYYDAPAPAGAGWSPFETIQYVFDGEDWQTDMSSPASNVLSDIAHGNLAAVSFVMSPHSESDSPGTRGGPAWVNTIVQAVRQSSYWADAAVLVIWDDEGDGLFYDSVAPPQLDFMGLGFRVPLIVVSRYAKRGYVSHTQYEFGSILKFIEQNWNLPYLGGDATDQRANSIANMFTFTR